MRILILAILLIITLSYYFYKKRNVLVEGASSASGSGSCPCWSNMVHGPDIRTDSAYGCLITVGTATAVPSGASKPSGWGNSPYYYCRGPPVNIDSKWGTVDSPACPSGFNCDGRGLGCDKGAPNVGQFCWKYPDLGIKDNRCCTPCNFNYSYPPCNNTTCNDTYVNASVNVLNNPCQGSESRGPQKCPAKPRCSLPSKSVLINGKNRTPYASPEACKNAPIEEHKPRGDCCGDTSDAYYICGTTCNNNSTPNTSVPGVCECNAGYGTDDKSTQITVWKPPTCEQCIQGTLGTTTTPGTYKNVSANKPCTACPANSYAVIPGATSIDACYCKPGLYMNNNTCEPVPKGNEAVYSSPSINSIPRNSTNGGATDINECAAGTYSVGGVQQCTPCDTSGKNAGTSVKGSSSCKLCDSSGKGHFVSNGTTCSCDTSTPCPSLGAHLNTNCMCVCPQGSTAGNIPDIGDICIWSECDNGLATANSIACDNCLELDATINPTLNNNSTQVKTVLPKMLTKFNLNPNDTDIENDNTSYTISKLNKNNYDILCNTMMNYNDASNNSIYTEQSTNWKNTIKNINNVQSKLHRTAQQINYGCGYTNIDLYRSDNLSSTLLDKRRTSSKYCMCEPGSYYDNTIKTCVSTKIIKNDIN